METHGESFDGLSLCLFLSQTAKVFGSHDPWAASHTSVRSLRYMCRTGYCGARRARGALRWQLQLELCNSRRINFKSEKYLSPPFQLFSWLTVYLELEMRASHAQASHTLDSVATADRSHNHDDLERHTRRTRYSRSTPTCCLTPLARQPWS